MILQVSQDRGLRWSYGTAPQFLRATETRQYRSALMCLQGCPERTLCAALKVKTLSHERPWDIIVVETIGRLLSKTA